MRLRDCLAASLVCIAPLTRDASAQAGSLGQQPSSRAGRELDVDRLSRFELQRMLTEIDERRRRLQSVIGPADSVLRLLAADTLRLTSAVRPPAIVEDSAAIHRLFLQLTQTPASSTLRGQLGAAIEAAADHFTSIETSLASRTASPRVARDYLERTPFAAVVPVPQDRPLENTVLLQALRRPPDPRTQTTLLPADLTDVERAVSEPAFQAYRAELLAAFRARMRDVQLLTRFDRDELAQAEQDAARVSRAIGERQSDQSRLDARVVTIGLPAIGLALVVLFLTPLLYRSEELRRSIITSGVLVELMTVFLLIAAVIILGVDGRIPAEVIGTLLGGVSGYVLGRAINPPIRT